MASRTSSSTGMIVFVGVTSLLSLALFVTSVMLFARVQRLNNDLKLTQGDLDAAVRADERDDRWEQLKSMARGKGVVRYLDGVLQETTQQITGSRRDDPGALSTKITTALGTEGSALLPLLASKNQEIANLKNQVKAADDARNAAQSDLQASVDRIRSLEEEHRKTVASLNAEIDVYKSSTDRYREGVETAKTEYTSSVDTIRTEAEANIASLESRVRDLDQQLLVASDQLRRLKQDQSSQSLRGTWEGALVDGTIVGVNAPARQAYLDLGRKQRLVLGMTFEVYTSASAIKPDEQGNYPTGKATLEIIKIDETTSTARILRENAGSPVISGDVIANAIYDPRKVYSFTVYGNFDTNNDGVATPQETQDIKGLIESWNGQLSDDLAGDTDFVVLGEKPVLPPQPRPNDPVELIQRYLLLRQQVAKYDELFEKSRQAGIPVLNQNRLYTLTGAGLKR